MNLFKSTLFLLVSLITTQAFSQYTDVINSNRPGVSRSAFSVGTNVVQFEVGPYMVKEERTPITSYKVDGFGVDFAARYGLLWEELEVNIEGSFQSDTKTYTSNISAEDARANFKFLTVGAKYLVYDPYKKEKAKPNLYSWKANQRFDWSIFIPAVSVYAGANYDIENSPYTAEGIEGVSPKIMIATQHNFNNGFVFVMNFIKDRIGTDQSDFQYIFTLTHSFGPKWVAFGEAQGIKSDFYADNLFRLGGGYLWTKNFQLDTAVTFNTKDTPSVFGVNLGMSYRLDFHKDKEIDNGTDAKNEGKSKFKKSKKSKKSTDVIEDLDGKQKKEDEDFN